MKSKINELDRQYHSLNCAITPIKKEEPELAMIQKYIDNTRGYLNCTLLDAFKLERNGEDARFNPDKLGNRTLLWHGSRFSNYVGILSQGLRIAPPEAPSTGYLFGKGIYMADMLGKAGNYTSYK